MTNEQAIIELRDLISDENTDRENEALVLAIEKLRDKRPTVEITEEQAIDKLHETGWMQKHDKEMTVQPKGEWIPVSERLPEPYRKGGEG